MVSTNPIIKPVIATNGMEVSAINPYKYLVVTRVLATTLMVPLLVILADGVGILGGIAGINIHSDVTFYR